MLKELGRFKNMIGPALYKSENIREVLLGKDYKDRYKSEAEIIKDLKSNIFSHLFIDEVIDETQTYIFYDVTMPRFSRSMKTCQVTIYAFCHKSLIDTISKQGYEGNRVDILCQMVESEVLAPENIREYGVGKLELTSVKLYSDQRKFYGKVMEFSVPDFR